MTCSKEFSMAVNSRFSQLDWTVFSFVELGTGTAHWDASGKNYSMDATAPNTAGSKGAVGINGDMVYQGTGVAVPCTLYLDVLTATGQAGGGGLTNVTAVCRVDVDGGTVASIPNPQNENVGSYSSSFNLPAAVGPHTVKVVVSIDANLVAGFNTSLFFSGRVDEV